jgi:hypothetical protein
MYVWYARQAVNLTSERIELVYVAAEQGALGQPLYTYIAHMLDDLMIYFSKIKKC